MRNKKVIYLAKIIRKIIWYIVVVQFFVVISEPFLIPWLPSLGYDMHFSRFLPGPVIIHANLFGFISAVGGVTGVILLFVLTMLSNKKNK